MNRGEKPGTLPGWRHTPLQGIAEGAMDTSAFFKDLEVRFRTLLPTYQSGTPQPAPNVIEGVKDSQRDDGGLGWRVRGADEKQRYEFETLSIAAARKLGGDGLGWWLERVADACSQYSSRILSWEGEREVEVRTIRLAPEASAVLCQRLAAEYVLPAGTADRVEGAIAVASGTAATVPCSGTPADADVDPAGAYDQSDVIQESERPRHPNRVLFEEVRANRNQRGLQLTRAMVSKAANYETEHNTDVKNWLRGQPRTTEADRRIRAALRNLSNDAPQRDM
jgi:hypothetical protein